jgi:hypothetical protein
MTLIIFANHKSYGQSAIKVIYNNRHEGVRNLTNRRPSGQVCKRVVLGVRTDSTHKEQVLWVFSIDRLGVGIGQLYLRSNFGGLGFRFGRCGLF